MTGQKTFKIATRQSALALWQARRVQSLLEERGIKAELFPVVTTGDKLQKSSLADVKVQSDEKHTSTGKGLFVKEIQESLLRGDAHIAVHSLKDLPVAQTTGLTLAALLPRAPAEDVFIPGPALLDYFAKEVFHGREIDFSTVKYDRVKKILRAAPSLKTGRIGTASARRDLLLKRLISPKLDVVALRGNVDTRLKRLQEGEFAAIVLARAGLERLGLFSHATMISLPAHDFVPAPAQGAIGIEIKEGDSELLPILKTLNEPSTLIPVGIERLGLAYLGGDCHMAVGIHAEEKRAFFIWQKDKKEAMTSMPISATEWRTFQSMLLLEGTTYEEFYTALKASPFAKTLYSFLARNGFDVVSL